MIFSLFFACMNDEMEVHSQKGKFILRQETTSFPLNSEFDFVFALFDKERNPHIAEITIDAEMPDTVYSLLEEPSISNTENVYTAAGMIFDHEGTWNINIRISDLGFADTARFSVLCCD